MSNGPEFLILKPPVGWLQEQKWKEILGAVVRNPWDATAAYAPKNALSFNRYGLDGLDEDSQEHTVIQLGVTDNPGRDFSVTGLGKLRWGRTLEH